MIGRAMRVGLTVLALGVFACGGDESDTIPSGTYQATCQQCSAKAGVLSCECINGRGNFGTQTLNYAACRGDIANCFGRLVCGLCSSAGAGDSKPGGCEADSDCARCERCERSTGKCLTRLTC